MITGGCFTYLYLRLNGAAAREGLSLVEYMTQVFANVRWLPWLGLMMVYSGFYFLVDTLVVTRALNWFIEPIRYRDILPIRASAYIISVFNEQIGKGAMAYYLNRRDQVPGWEVASVMLFIMFCEVFYLLSWATIGFTLSADSLPEVFGLIPYIAAGSAVFLVLWILYFRGRLMAGNQMRNRKIAYAFKIATVKHYALFFLFRSPALLAAVVVYTLALNLFWSGIFLPVAAGVLAGHLFCGSRPDADAGGGDYVLGHSLSRERRPDGGVWICAAQLLHLVQRVDRGGVLAPGPA